MRHSKLTAAVLLVLALVTVVYGQAKEPKQPIATKNPPAKSATPAADPAAVAELKERRDRARSLLIALSSDARTFNDQTLRARSLARIADALWRVDPEQGRVMFRKAWEAAEVADQESDRKVQEEIRQQQARTGNRGYAINLPPNVRREVLRLAARHDKALGEEFLEKLKAQKVDPTSVTANPNRLSDALSQRLSVALELMRSGELERALEFAEPALAMVERETVNFLTYLREKNPAVADARYKAMLASAATNPQSDANTVSLLSSYIFTPHLYVTFSGSGTSTSQMNSEIKPADVTPELRNAFFQSAASILLRPLPQPGQPDQSSSGLDGKYLVIKRLLPFFEQFASADIVESLRAHLNALNSLVTDNTRRRDDEWINKGVKPDKPEVDREQALLDRIDRAKTSAERDSLYIQLAGMAAAKADMKAREYASKVEDPEIRKQVVAFFDASLAMNSVQKKLTDQALELVSKGELTHLMKTWVLTECAKVIAKQDQTKAMDLVEEAATEARRIDVSDPNLPRALVAVAYAFKVVDLKRVWDATFDAVKAANSAQGFSGEDGEFVLTFQSKGSSSVQNSGIPEFDLEGIFRDLADQDYDRAVELARGFQGEGPRAVATIAIARAVLDPKKAAKR
ncbi:MAG TPA: hypothetical protein VFU83_06140 [Pyrinomonadaceae bacterium]|nr:hypothetical protein [Pyrinomonadaceae bacterium]